MERCFFFVCLFVFTFTLLQIIGHWKNVKLQEIMAQKTEVEEKLSYKYERWEYLNQLAEEIENSKK